MVDDDLNLLNILNDFEIGDLVRLNEDIDLQIGLGLVIDIKLNFDDVYDVYEIRRKLQEFKDKYEMRQDDFFPVKPQILVLWNNSKLFKSGNKEIWMYSSELTIVQKVVK